MKPLFRLNGALLFLSFALLTSCTNSFCHVSSLQSEQVKLVDKDFVFENEQLKVVYNLWEEGGRMRFLVFNKLDRPVYIDWSKSFLVRNGAKITYNELPQLSRRNTSDTVRYTYQEMRAEPYRTTARGNLFTEVEPQTFVAIADIPIQQVVEHKRTKEKLFKYSQSNSPLKIAHQLAYSFDKSLENTQLTEQLFWVNQLEVLRTGALVRSYGSLEKGKLNALYAVERQGATARIVIITGIVATVSVLIVLDNLFSGFTMGF